MEGRSVAVFVKVGHKRVEIRHDVFGVFVARFIVAILFPVAALGEMAGEPGDILLDVSVVRLVANRI